MLLQMLNHVWFAYLQIYDTDIKNTNSANKIIDLSYLYKRGHMTMNLYSTNHCLIAN